MSNVEMLNLSLLRMIVMHYYLLSLRRVVVYVDECNSAGFQS